MAFAKVSRRTTAMRSFGNFLEDRQVKIVIVLSWYGAVALVSSSSNPEFSFFQGGLNLYHDIETFSSFFVPSTES